MMAGTGEPWNEIHCSNCHIMQDEIGELLRVALTQDKRALTRYIKENYYPVYALHNGD